MSNQSSLVTENGLSILPDEVLCMILSWLEVKYLLRCKSVCKVWNSVLVNNTQFIDMHAIHNGCRSDHIVRQRTTHIIRRIDLDLINSNKKKENFKFLSSCRGLVLRGLYRPCYMAATKYVIWNPTTKRRLDLPHPHKGVIAMRIFLNSSTNSYHVVSLYNDEENKVKIELIDLGGQSNDPCPNEDVSWRTLDIPAEYDGRLLKYDCSHCVLEESILFIPALLGSSNPIIVCVDLVQQACTTINAPESLCFENCKVNLQLWRGKPALSFVSEEKLNVWILEDYKKHKWADPILIPLPSLNEYPPLRKQIPQIYHGDEEDFLVYTDQLFSNNYIFGYHICKIGSQLLSYSTAAPPVRVPATLVSVKGMRPQNRRKRRRKRGDIEHPTTT